MRKLADVITWSHLQTIFGSFFGRVTIFFSLVIALSPLTEAALAFGMAHLLGEFAFKIAGVLLFILANIVYVIFAPNDIRHHSGKSDFVAKASEYITTADKETMFNRCIESGVLSGVLVENTEDKQVLAKYWDVLDAENFVTRVAVSLLAGSSLIGFYVKDLIAVLTFLAASFGL